MRPDQPWLVKCPHCADLFWLDEARQLAEQEYGKPTKSKYRDAKDVKTPTCADYYRLLAHTQGDRKKERYVRMRAWWAANASNRKSKKAPGPLKDRDKKNLNVLFGLIDGVEPGDVIMKAEIARELGRFDDCLQLLSGPFEEGFLPVVELIKKLARERDCRLAEIVTDQQ